MLITQTISWTALAWPATTNATQYALFQLYPSNTPSVPIATISGATSYLLSYDDSANLLYQVRPTDGTNYGPVAGTFVFNYVPCRAYIRQGVRYALADQANQVGVTVNWTDDEINRYINEAIPEISRLFPQQKDTTISLLPPALSPSGNLADYRKYPLPSDFFSMRSVEYVTQEGNLHLYLKYKPFRGGESTAQTYIGYPKLGILLSPLNGRYYPGHYDIYEGNIIIDWGPAGDGDSLTITYLGSYPLFTDDGTLTTIPVENLELLSLRAQVKCWLRVEASDTSLSRWIEQAKRDGLPTEVMSKRIQKLYDQIVNDRRENRIRTLRMVRR